MARTLYDLAGADEKRRFSPHCWRVKMALAHKGLPFDTVPWRFTEKEAIAFSGQGLVPVLVDDARVVTDSWVICHYLDQAYPDRPPLADSAQSRAHAQFIRQWTDRVLQPLILRIIILDIHAQLHPRDQAYFRSSREARLGTTLEDAAADRPGHLAALHTVLAPLRATLAAQPFLGDGVGLADYVVFGSFQWARCTSPLPLIASDDPIHAWRERMLGLHDGLAAHAPGFPTTVPPEPRA